MLSYGSIKPEKYGCHNRQDMNRIVEHSQDKRMAWPHRMSTDCKYDKSQTDKYCSGCKHVKGDK